MSGDYQKTRSVIKKAAFAIVALCASALVIFAIFPKLVIWILFGSQYVSMAHILLYIGIAFSFISFLNLLVLYRISVDEFKMVHAIYLLLFFVVQIILLSLIPPQFRAHFLLPECFEGLLFWCHDDPFIEFYISALFSAATHALSRHPLDTDGQPKRWRLVARTGLAIALCSFHGHSGCRANQLSALMNFGCFGQHSAQSRITENESTHDWRYFIHKFRRSAPG